jgi:hypothetical protein
MTNTLIDPRPLEPDWVREAPCTDTVQWTIRRHLWNRETKRYIPVHEHGHGNTLACLSAIAAILNSRNIECEIIIHSNDLEQRDGGRPYHYDLKYPSGYDLGVFWNIDHPAVDQDGGRDTDELMDWTEYLLSEGKEFTIELSWFDPTP